MFDVSIVIVSYNTSDLLDRCLETVFAGSKSLSKEVIIVENASVDGTRSMLENKWPQLQVILNDENRGYAPACNQGLKVASGRYIMALNSDAFLEGDALQKMVSFLEENQDVAAVGPKLLNADGTVQLVCARRDPTFLSVFVMYSRLASYFPALAPYVLRHMPKNFYSSTSDVPILAGSCILFRPSAFEKVGMLEDSLIINYDDIEWSQRARRSGCRLVYYPEAEVTHLEGASRLFDVGRERLINIVSTFRFFNLTFNGPAALILKLLIIWSLVVAVIKNIVLVPFSKSRRKILALRFSLLRGSIGMLFNRG